MPLPYTLSCYSVARSLADCAGRCINTKNATCGYVAWNKATSDCKLYAVAGGCQGDGQQTGYAVYALDTVLQDKARADCRGGTRPELFNFTPMAVNSISFGPPHVRPLGVHRTRGGPDEIKKNARPKSITALVCD